MTCVFGVNVTSSSIYIASNSDDIFQSEDKRLSLYCKSGVIKQVCELKMSDIQVMEARCNISNEIPASSISSLVSGSENDRLDISALTEMDTLSGDPVYFNGHFCIDGDGYFIQ